MIFEVYPRIAPRSPSTMVVDSPSPISRLADQFQRENLGAHGSPEMPGKCNQYYEGVPPLLLSVAREKTSCAQCAVNNLLALRTHQYRAQKFMPHDITPAYNFKWNPIHVLISAL